MYNVLKKGTVLIRKPEMWVPYINSNGEWASKPVADIYGEIYSVSMRKQEYHIVWDGGDWDVIHFWELPRHSDIRIATKAEIVLFRKSD